MKIKERSDTHILPPALGILLLGVVALGGAVVADHRAGEAENKQPACAVKLASGSGVGIIQEDLRTAGDDIQGKIVISDGYKLVNNPFPQAGNYAVLDNVNTASCNKVGGIVVDKVSAALGMVLNQPPATTVPTYQQP